jgi:glycosyltransferase involved in cell wall biosynthesis
MTDKIYIVEGCDFESFPIGGQLSFCRSLVQAFPEGTFRLVGITTEPDEVGRWVKKRLFGRTLDVFAVCRIDPTRRKRVPRRLVFFLKLRKFRRKLFGSKACRVISHAPETLLALRGVSELRILHIMHGVGNPLAISTFRWARSISRVFDRIYAQALEMPTHVLATASGNAIADYRVRHRVQREICKFPTRYDEAIFFPRAHAPRAASPRMIAVGRLHPVKNYPFMLEAFRMYLDRYGEATLRIIGDGEERAELDARVASSGLRHAVTLQGAGTPMEIADSLRAADIYLLSSRQEGWPTTLVEALACRLPVVSTLVSGADEAVIYGANGFLVAQDDIEGYVEAMEKARFLTRPIEADATVARWSISRMACDLSSSFPDFFARPRGG